MKKKLFILLGVLLCAGAIAYCTPPYPVTLELAVTDGEGKPISDGEVLTYSITYKNWEDSKSENTTGKTDSNGIFIGDIRTVYRFWAVIEKEGYYGRGTGDIYYGQELKGKPRGTPLTVKRELVMRKILNPVDLVKRYDPLLIKAVDEKLGFDLDKMDWIAPYGEGKKSDFYLEQNGYWKDNSGYDVKLTLSFPNEGDGIFAFDPDKDEFRFAPETGYQSSKEWKIERVRENLGTSKEVRTDINEFMDEKKNYFLRVRTVLDKDGKVIRGNYACIKRDLIESYLVSSGKGRYLYGQLGVNFFFNPEVNNRSLEQKISK